MILDTAREKAWIEGNEEVSHSRTWMLLCCLFRDLRAERSDERERVLAMTVLEGSEESWLTNSRPIPLFAPVMT